MRMTITHAKNVMGRSKKDTAVHGVEIQTLTLMSLRELNYRPMPPPTPLTPMPKSPPSSSASSSSEEVRLSLKTAWDLLDSIRTHRSPEWGSRMELAKAIQEYQDQRMTIRAASRPSTLCPRCHNPMKTEDGHSYVCPCNPETRVTIG